MAGIEMGALLDQAGAFGNTSYEQHLMPIVYIDKITLENNSVPPLVPDNPHIEDYTSRVTGTGEVEYQQAAMQTTSDACYVTIDMIVKDAIGNSALSSWFYEQDDIWIDHPVLDYMKITVLQSTYPDITQALIDGQFTILSDAESSPHVTKKIISLRDYYETTQDFYTANESGSGLVASIPYQTTFQLPNSQPQHLAYFAYCFFDIAELTAAYNLNMYGYSNTEGVISKNITSEVVIENGTVVSTSYVFYTPEGTLWTGAIHQHDGVWMAGETHTNTYHPVLTMEAVPNTTVQDFRDIDAPFQAEINLTYWEGLLSLLRDRYDANEVKIEENIAYFSDGHVSRTEADGNPAAGIMFSFDIDNFIKQKSHFGAMMDFSQNDLARAEMMRLSRIVSLRVYRYRASKEISYNKVGTPVKGGRFKQNPYDGSEYAPVLVAMSSDNSSGILKSETDDDGAIREINLGIGPGVRTFAVTDKTIDDVTDGVYQYAVEVEVKDGTVEFLNAMLKQMLIANKDFSLYASLSTSPKFYDASTNQFKPEFMQYYTHQLGNNFISAPWVTAPARLCEALGVITNVGGNLVLNAIYEQLYGWCNPVTGTPQGVYAVSAQAEGLASILVSYLGTKDSVSINRTGKTDYSQAFEKFVLKDTQFFTQMMDAEIPDMYGLDFFGMDNRNQFSGPATFTVTDYEARLLQENAKYFLVPEVDMGAQVGVDVPNPAFTDLSAYGATYLTPVLARNGNSTLSINADSDLSQDLEKYSFFSIPLLAREDQKRGQAASVVWHSVQISHERIDFLSQLGISVNSIYEQITSGAGIREPDITGLVDAVSALGSGTPFADSDIEYSNFPNVLVEPDIEKIGSLFSSDLPLQQDQGLHPNVRYIADNAVEQINIADYNPDGTQLWRTTDQYLMPPDMNEHDLEEVRKIPNQIKSLFLSATEGLVRVNWFEYDPASTGVVDVANDPSTAPMFIWNYQNIAKIEYLHSYKSSAVGLQISAPVWEPLTFGVLNNLPATESGIIACRLVKYDDAVNKIGYSTFAKIPYYDSYFFISSDQATADSGGLS